MPLPNPPSPTLRRLQRRQHGVATRAQLLEAGVTAGHVRAQIHGRRWQRLNERVVCTHNGPLTRRQAMWSALLSAPPQSALCGLTVLELRRIWGFGTAEIHLLIGKGARVLAVPGVVVVVHETRTFPTDEVRLFDDFRATLPARAVVDAASWAGDDFTAARLLTAGVQQLRVQPALLTRQVQSRPKLPRRRLLLLLCRDLEGGAQALSELEFLKFCTRHGLPRPRLQVRADSAGRRRYLDAIFRRPDGSTFGVEIDGGVHLKLEVRSKDDIKDNDAKLDRKLVLRYTSFAIYTDQPDAVRQIKAAFDRRTGVDGNLWRGRTG